VSSSVLSGPDDHVDRSTVDDWLADRRYGAAPRLALTNRGTACTRLVVIAAHPDDESLGAGGLIATAAAQGLSVYVVLLTAGEASPYASAGKTRHALATMRLAETENALARLAPDNYLVFLGAPDGAVTDTEEQVARSLSDLVGEGDRTLLVAPWRHDGHADHDAAGRAAAVAARASGARLLEYPLVAWSRSEPDDLPWEHVTCLPLTATVREQKERAIRAHVSQVRGVEPGGPTPLPGRVLAHFHTPVEHYVEKPPADPADPAELVDPA
jgi:LmbE family N-acetylglucosaminyl deacetylase